MVLMQSACCLADPECSGAINASLLDVSMLTLRGRGGDGMGACRGSGGARSKWWDRAASPLRQLVLCLRHHCQQPPEAVEQHGLVWQQVGIGGATVSCRPLPRPVQACDRVMRFLQRLSCDRIGAVSCQCAVQAPDGTASSPTLPQMPAVQHVQQAKT